MSLPAAKAKKSYPERSGSEKKKKRQAFFPSSPGCDKLWRRILFMTLLKIKISAVTLDVRTLVLLLIPPTKMER